MYAKKTLKAIDRALENDQGARYRTILREILPQIEDAYRGAEDGFRGHLGASLIGRECPRHIWYGFRWCTKPEFPGRIIRLFNRGHLEEGRFVAALMAAGFAVWQSDDSGQQFRIIGHRGHFGGSLDGVGRGFLELPTVPMLLEFKTHNANSFKKLTEGFRNSKFEHFVQMQIYMGHYNLTHGLYMATNKNDDGFHAEIIEYDDSVRRQFEDRAAMIIDAENPPKRISNSPGWHACKFCSDAPVCHKNQPPEVNCRTCESSKPIDDGKWWCRLHDVELDKETQHKGCKDYTLLKTINMKE